MLNYDKPSRIFPCILLIRNHMIFLVQFGIKTTNCTRPTGSCNFVSLWKNLLVLIYSKLHSKSCDYLYKNADRDQNFSFYLIYFQRSGLYTHWFLHMCLILLFSLHQAPANFYREKWAKRCFREWSFVYFSGGAISHVWWLRKYVKIRLFEGLKFH